MEKGEEGAKVTYFHGNLNVKEYSPSASWFTSPHVRWLQMFVIYLLRCLPKPLIALVFLSYFGYIFLGRVILRCVLGKCVVMIKVDGTGS
jgi:hypothetical protein